MGWPTCTGVRVTVKVSKADIGGGAVRDKGTCPFDGSSKGWPGCLSARRSPPAWSWVSRLLPCEVVLETRSAQPVSEERMRIGVDLLWSQVLVAVAKQARDAVQPRQAVKAAVAVVEGHRQVPGTRTRATCLSPLTRRLLLLRAHAAVEQRPLMLFVQAPGYTSGHLRWYGRAAVRWAFPLTQVSGLA